MYVTPIEGKPLECVSVCVSMCVCVLDARACGWVGAYILVMLTEFYKLWLTPLPTAD